MYGASVLTARMVECPLECRRSARRGIQTVRAADVMSSIQEWASTTAPAAVSELIDALRLENPRK